MAKRLLLLRHGQALHNVRAEAAREGGCSYDAFLQIMKEDDVLDADLTEIGRQQARAVAAARAGMDEPELVVASCLSRALETAALAFPRTTVAPGRFVCIEALREINGYLINGQRRPRTELATRFAACDFSSLSDEHDTQVRHPRTPRPAAEPPTSQSPHAPGTQWTADLESNESAAARAYDVLIDLARRRETYIGVVAHGGLFHLLLNKHPKARRLARRPMPARLLNSCASGARAQP